MLTSNFAPNVKTLAAAVALVGLMAGCGSKAPEAPAEAAPVAVAPADQASAPPAEATVATDTEADQVETLLGLTPEGMEALLAPIALYPDAVLAHVLTAATNPQMVLDAGNWLIANPDLSGRALDEAAQPLGFSPSMRALLQFPEIVDMMCMQMDWTTQLGEAFTADQAGALDAVQRLRMQAASVGNLASSEQLTVANEVQDGREVITVAPADPKVVYVPQYDPVAVYAPPPAVVPAPTVAPAPASTGHSTGSLITTGLLSFGAGLLIAEVFDDDDDWDDYRPNYGYGGMYYGGRPYYPPPPGFYRPSYGGSFRPGSGYTRPPNYQHGFNNNVIVVNNQGNDYWGGFGNGNGNGAGNRPGNGGLGGNNGNRPQRPTSPISSARPDRPELRDPDRKPRPTLAQDKPRPRPAADDKAAGWQGQSSYAGAKDRPKDSPAAAARPGYAGARDKAGGRPDASAGASQRAAAAAAANTARDRPKPQGAVDRGRDDKPQLSRPSRPEARKPEAAPQRRDLPTAANRPAQRPEQRPAQRPQQRPEARPEQRPQRQRDNAGANRGGARPSSFGGQPKGRNDQAASDRGRRSLPDGARSKGAARQPTDSKRQRR